MIPANSRPFANRSLLAIITWLLTSAVFGWYLTTFGYRAHALIVTEAKGTGKRRTRCGRPAR